MRHAMKKPIYILNGPNLNMLGSREPEIYGTETLADIQAKCADQAHKMGFEISFFQSNIEGELVDKIQQAKDVAHAIIINAGLIPTLLLRFMMH